ncbi:RsmF rRNA methyltransferase first C-terminal domain-containing protein [Levilactobacillus bambusae]|uniref:RNA methyltransferase n=1 Tax=Levilactobacillus bambusae TaxID=2024736 RepID=A0A2V1N4N2_9LACO|nr:RsmF rRNA methyltransferase first C-terminal domain-containing protein [Levilactobacillus bambusae]PWG00876.1 RNA methyltransferase [Levilactobacillus bambusae]
MAKLPQAFIDKYQQLMGPEAQAFFASFDEPVKHGFRINPLKQSIPTGLDLSEPVPYAKWGYYGEVHGRSVAHQSGAIYSQEPSAMFVGATAHPERGDRVLDLCAAPGGKSTHLASYLDNTGLLVSNEIMKKRVGVLAENIERFGPHNTVILNESPERLTRPFAGFFDKVVVDAPCSGEGMFRKDPEAMAYWDADYPQKCAALQREILTEAVKMVRPGGQLVYSTCTFAPEEDEQTIAWLLDQYPEFHLIPIEKTAGISDARPEWANGNPELKKAARLFPNQMLGEGHFVAKLQADADWNQGAKPAKPQQVGLTREQQKLWTEFSADQLIGITFPHLLTFGDQLYSVPAEMPAFGKLKVERPGLHLGTFKKKRFEPSYALALAVKPEQAQHQLTINHEQWAKVVHGETITIDEEHSKGWYLLVCDNQPVAYGKLVGKTIKNFFPKGLRFQVYD